MNYVLIAIGQIRLQRALVNNYPFKRIAIDKYCTRVSDKLRTFLKLSHHKMFFMLYFCIVLRVPSGALEVLLMIPLERRHLIPLEIPNRKMSILGTGDQVTRKRFGG